LTGVPEIDVLLIFAPANPFWILVRQDICPIRESNLAGSMV